MAVIPPLNRLQWHSLKQPKVSLVFHPNAMPYFMSSHTLRGWNTVSTSCSQSHRFWNPLQIKNRRRFGLFWWVCQRVWTDNSGKKKHDISSFITGAFLDLQWSDTNWTCASLTQKWWPGTAPAQLCPRSEPSPSCPLPGCCVWQTPPLWCSCSPGWTRSGWSVTTGCSSPHLNHQSAPLQEGE